MVHENNRCTEQHLETQELSKRSQTPQWKPTTNEQILQYYWSKSKLYGSEVIQNTMSRDKFELFLKFYHFSNNEENHTGHARLFKLKLLLDLLKARFKSINIPGSVITIDETMGP